MTDEEAQADTERNPMFAADAARSHAMTIATTDSQHIHETHADGVTPPPRCVDTAHITKSERLRREACAEKEAAWFYGTLGGRVPDGGRHRDAALVIEQWQRSILTYHRGALALWYEPGDWPPWMAEIFRSSLPLVVRLECALHPAVGRSNEDLVAASVARIAGLIREARKNGRKRGREIRVLDGRAKKYFRLAVRALASARGGAPCMAPTEGR